MSKKGAGIVGHADLIINDEVMSYGNYDGSSWRLHESVGDGVIFFAKKDGYIPFVIKDSEKTLFAFGLKLNEQQKTRVINRINEIKNNLYEWKPPVYSESNPPYAARLNHAVNTKFYKVKKGEFKTYFVLGTNCVKLVDSIVGKAGIDILEISGIITPGVYYEYLDKEFAKPNTIVISKKIYN